MKSNQLSGEDMIHERAAISFRLKSAILIFLAVVVRVALMPISLHGDIFYIHSMPPVILSEGAWNIFKYFGPFGARFGYIHYAPLVGYITAVSEFVGRIVSLPFYEFLLELPKIIQVSEGDGWSALFAQYSLFHRMLFAFLMKSPYLLFDLAVGLFIYFAFRDEKQRGWLWILAAWMFHPVLLYGTYIFGQHRIYSAMFAWLAILLFKRGRTAWACFAFGWILLLDNFGFIAFLPFVLAVAGNFKTAIKYGLIAALPFLAVFIPLFIDSNGYVYYAYLCPRFIWQATHAVFPSIPHSALIFKVIFLSSFAYIVWTLVRNFKFVLSSEAQLQLVSYVWCAVILVFYSGTMVSVHYFLWILPFFMLLTREGTPWPKYLNFILIFLLFFFNLDSRSQNMSLFSPLNPNAPSWPSFHEWIVQWVPWWGKVIGLSRMTFAVLCLFMAWRLIEKKAKPLLQTASSQVAAGHARP